MSIHAVEMTWQTLSLLFVTGLFAGFVDSIAGGGGLISLPVLFFTGLPPHVALGTNKLQGSFGTLSSSYNYIRKGTVSFKEIYPGIFFTFVGAVTGACLIQKLDPGFINHIVPFLLLFVFVYTLVTPEIGDDNLKPKMSGLTFFIVFGLALGFYDGFFGPGTGSFWTGLLLILLGLNMTKAAGVTRIMNFTSNILALTVFILGNNVLYSAGFCMGAGQFIGSRAGSTLAIKKGAPLIRPLFLTVVFLTIIRLLYLNYAK